MGNLEEDGVGVGEFYKSGRGEQSACSKWVIEDASEDHVGVDLAEFSDVGGGVENGENVGRWMGMGVTKKVVETLHAWLCT